MNFYNTREWLIRKIYLPEELNNDFSLGGIIKNAFKNGIHETAIETKQWLLDSINNSIDGLGLITVMITWMLHMMSVPSAGKWCYITFAIYIVIKILIKSFSMI